MEIFFLLLRTIEEMPIVADLIDDYGKVLERSAFALPSFSNGEPSEAFIGMVKVEMSPSKIQNISKDTQITESVSWIHHLDKRFLQLREVLSEAGIPDEKYKSWAREKQPGDSFADFFERGLAKEERLIRWAKVIYFFQKTGFGEETVSSMINFWVKMLERNEPVFMRFGKELEVIEDEELGSNSSILLMKQKMLVWLANRRKEGAERFEFLASVFPFIDRNIKFVNEDSEAYIAFSRFLFIRYIASKNLQNFRIQMLTVREKVRCLEYALGTQIWGGRELEPALFESQVLRRPAEREKWELFVQKVFKETLDSFIVKTEEGLEYLIGESRKAKRRQTEIFLRLQHVSFLLAFNINTKYQSKINASIKSLKALSSNFKAVQKAVFGLEIEHYSQLKNYKKLAGLLSKIKAFEGFEVNSLVPVLLQKLPESNMVIEDIDRRIFEFTDFGIKTYSFTEKGLVFKVFVKYETQIDKLELEGLVLSLGTGYNECPQVRTEVFENLVIDEEAGSFELDLVFPSELKGKTNFLIIQVFEFKFCGIAFRISEFPELKNKNVNLDSLPCLHINSSGFVNRLGPSLLFFEENGPNHFFIEFSVFDNRSHSLSNLILEIQKSSKYLILHPTVKLFTDSQTSEHLCQCEKIAFPELAPGRYVLLITIYLLHSKLKNYKLKMNCQYKGQSKSFLLNLKAKEESFYFLENKLQYVSEEFSQLRIGNRNNEPIRIIKINEKAISPPRNLISGEELSLIIPGSEEVSLEYEITGKRFESLPIHALIGRHEPGTIKRGNIIEGKVLRIEQFIFNKDLNIKSLEIKNRREVKIFEQNYFLLHYTFRSSVKDCEDKMNGNAEKKIYLELKWSRDKYCIIGKHRFLLKSQSNEKRKEIAFIPFESGFLSYPQILLVEKRADGSEIQHLLNENKHLKAFFVHESVIKTTQIVSKLKTA